MSFFTTELTNQLRYFEKRIVSSCGRFATRETTLQQASKNMKTGELIWQDIEVVKEK